MTRLLRSGISAVLFEWLLALVIVGVWLAVDEVLRRAVTLTLVMVGVC